MEKLVDALVRAQKKIGDANKSAVNEFYKNKKNATGSPYATLEDVIAAVKEHLLEENILYQQISTHVEGGICIETVFHGHGASLHTGPVYVPADKQTPHGYGSALTYARRYSLSVACGIGAADDDGNRAQVEATQTKPTTIKKVADTKPSESKKDDELPF
jgi:hypothetical protein|tara:strand:+ start:2826 stop:3305 length:480 start_codon:yes stop_codon:yes gene_type:complete